MEGCESISEPTDTAVVFIDLAGFTALTEARGDHEAAELAEEFACIARAELHVGDRFVKAIGDAIMLTSPTPQAALDLVRRIADATTQMGRFPVLRTGINFGPVVHSRTDVYGSTVNIAARIAALAEPGQVLATSPIVAAAGRSGMDTAAIGSRELRNVNDPVEVYRVDGLVPPCDCLIVDPVCRKRLDDGATFHTLTYASLTYRFCSTSCADRFADSPLRFAAAALCPAPAAVSQRSGATSSQR